jgi:2-iminobutanoate/2-iminopropanoate deaminase
MSVGTPRKSVDPLVIGTLSGRADMGCRAASVASARIVPMTPITRTPTPFSYSSAVAAGEFVFLGLHRGFGDDFTAQLDGALEGAAATLAEHGLPLTSLVKVNVWLRDIADLPTMEHRFEHHFPTREFPARMTATTAFVDDDCLVMVEGIAYRGPTV